MTGIFCLILGLSLFWMEVLKPLRARVRTQAARRSADAILMRKIRSIRNYYPGLRNLTPKEIYDRYDIDHAYNEIGRY